MVGDLSVYEGLEQGQPWRIQMTMLRNAGFREVNKVWREGGEAVIEAVK